LQKSGKAAILAAMKAALTISSRGTVTLTARLRQSLGLKADDQLIAATVPEGLLLRPAVTLPVEIYTERRIAEFDAAEAELARVQAPKKRRGRSRACHVLIQGALREEVRGVPSRLRCCTDVQGLVGIEVRVGIAPKGAPTGLAQLLDSRYRGGTARP